MSLDLTFKFSQIFPKCSQSNEKLKIFKKFLMCRQEILTDHKKVINRFWKIFFIVNLNLVKKLSKIEGDFLHISGKS